MSGEGIGPAHMSGQGRDDEAPGLIHHQHPGVLVFGLEVRPDQADHGPQGDEEDDLIIGRKEGADLVPQGA